jgi:hypothetical protein
VLPPVRATVVPDAAWCVSTVGTVVVFGKSRDDVAFGTAPRAFVLCPCSAAFAFSLFPRAPRPLTAASTALTSLTLALVVVAVTTFAVAAANALAGFRVGNGIRVRNADASSFPSRRLDILDLGTGCARARVLPVLSCAYDKNRESRTSTTTPRAVLETNRWSNARVSPNARAWCATRPAPRSFGAFGGTKRSCQIFVFGNHRKPWPSFRMTRERRAGYRKRLIRCDGMEAMCSRQV